MSDGLKLRQYKNDSTQPKNFFCFGISALFRDLYIYIWVVKNRGNFKTELSRSYIVLSLCVCKNQLP